MLGSLRSGLSTGSKDKAAEEKVGGDGGEGGAGSCAVSGEEGEDSKVSRCGGSDFAADEGGLAERGRAAGDEVLSNLMVGDGARMSGREGIGICAERHEGGTASR